MRKAVVGIECIVGLHSIVNAPNSTGFDVFSAIRSTYSLSFLRVEAPSLETRVRPIPAESRPSQSLAETSGYASQVARRFRP